MARGFTLTSTICVVPILTAPVGQAADPPTADQVIARLLRESARTLAGRSASQLLALATVNAEVIAGQTQVLQTLVEQVREARLALIGWQKKVREAGEDGRKELAVELARREQVYKRLTWDRDDTGRQALRRTLELAVAERLLARAGRKLLPGTFDLKPSKHGVAYALVLQRLGAHLERPERLVLLSALRSVGKALERLKTRGPASAGAAEPARAAVCRLPDWRFGDRWDVTCRAPDLAERHGIFMLKAIRWTAATVQYEVALYSAEQAEQKHAWTASLYLESRMTGRPSWPWSDYERPKPRDLYPFELRFRNPGQTQWTRRLLKDYGEGPFPCIGRQDGVRIDFPYLWNQTYVPGVGRYYPISAPGSAAHQRVAWDTIQIMGDTWSGKDGAVRIDLIRPKDDPEKPAVAIQWHTETGWWRRVEGQGYVARLLARKRLANTPLDVLAEVKARLDEQDTTGLVGLVDPRIREDLSEEAIAKRLRVVVERLASLRPAQVSFTDGKTARLWAIEPPHGVDIRFRLEDERWTIHRSVFGEE